MSNENTESGVGLPPSPPPTKNERPIAPLLRLVNGEGFPEEIEAEVEALEKVEVDERWLVSYADKMTLLCGFFILLFAMSTMDKAKLQKVKESAEKSFGTPELAIPKAGSAGIDQKGGKENDSDAFTAKNEGMELFREETKSQIKALTTENNTLHTSVQEKEQEIDGLKKQQLTLMEDNQKLRTEYDSEISQLNTVKKDLKATKDQMLGLQAHPNGNFLAFVMNWATEAQDVDLKVKDPSGKIFDFKRRSYKDHPGRFVLDTRRGPGSEVWQSDKLIPGIYEFTYHFYNSYGNSSPCPVTGTLFTTTGSLDLPTATLNQGGVKDATYKISVDANGKPTFLH